MNFPLRVCYKLALTDQISPHISYIATNTEFVFFTFVPHEVLKLN